MRTRVIAPTLAAAVALAASATLFSQAAPAAQGGRVGGPVDLEDRERPPRRTRRQRPVVAGDRDEPGEAVVAGAGEARRHPRAVGDADRRDAPGVEAAAGEDAVEQGVEEPDVVAAVARSDPPPRSGGAYLKLERKVGDFATAAVAVQLTLNAQNVCTRAGVALTNVGSTPIEAVDAGAFLLNKPLDDGTIAQAAQLAAAAADPFEDRRGTADYKRDVVRVLTARAVRLAAGRARGELATTAGRA